jgi:hypothetical protein
MRDKVVVGRDEMDRLVQVLGLEETKNHRGALHDAERLLAEPQRSVG